VQKKNKVQVFFLSAGLLFALLSSGGMFKTIAYKILPFIGYIRLNGEFRIFSLLSFIIVASIALEKFINQKLSFKGTIEIIYILLELLLFAGISIGLYHAIRSDDGLLHHTTSILSQAGTAAKLKMLIDSISFYDCLWIQGTLQLFFIWGIKYCLKTGKSRLLLQLSVVNMIITSLLNIPFTGVGKASVADVQSVLNQSPKGIPIPTLKPIQAIKNIPGDQMQLTGDWSFYNKQIGTCKQVAYPIALKNMQEYFNLLVKDSTAGFSGKPFLFTTNEQAHLSIRKFSPNYITTYITSVDTTSIILQQNKYPHWNYTIDGERNEVLSSGVNFMSAPVPKGFHSISFRFEPVLITYMMLASLVIFIVILIIVFSRITK
jgi:hypothetical protein